MNKGKSFDASLAWADALALIRRSAGLQLVLAGTFLFLPQLLLFVIAPDLLTSSRQVGFPAASEGATQQVAPSLLEIAISLAIGLLQIIGMLAMTAVMDKRRRPTVGQALATGGRGLLTMVGTILLLVLIALLAILPFAILISLTGSGSIILVLAGAIGAVVLLARFSIVTPLIAIEGMRSPVKVFARAWKLTGQSSGKIAAFYALLIIAGLVIGVVLALISGAILALDGGQGGVLYGLVILVQSAISAAINVLIAAIAVAVYYQLNGTDDSGIARVFD